MGDEQTSSMSKPHPSKKLLEVAVPAPLRKTFQYLPNEGCPDIKPGCRVLVPFGRQTLVGVFLGYSNQPSISKSKLRTILEVIDEAPVLHESILQLCLWASDYYHHPIGDVVSSALPVLLRKGIPGIEPILELGLSLVGREANEDQLKSAPRQKELFHLLSGQSHSKEALKRQGVSSTTVRALIQKEMAQWQVQQPEANIRAEPFVCDYQNIEPNEWQLSAIEHLPVTDTLLNGTGKKLKMPVRLS